MISETDIHDKTIAIAWRDDGEMFAVNFTRDNRRVFKVFSSECEFLYEGEYKPGLGFRLAWKPDGTLLAIDHFSKLGRKLMFFEKNGLFRFDFKLQSEVSILFFCLGNIGNLESLCIRGFMRNLIFSVYAVFNFFCIRGIYFFLYTRFL